MNCLDKLSLQKYLDMELENRSRLHTETHLQECEKCRSRLKEISTDRKQVLEFLSQLDYREEPMAIPDPSTLLGRQGGIFGTISRSMIFRVAASLALVIGIFLIAKNGSLSSTREWNEAELLYLDLQGDMEPNRSWHEGQTLLVLLDKDGEIIDSNVPYN
jgi:anti-sigma factor RsiW